MLCVVRGIGSAEHCLDRIILDELFERWVGLLATSGSCQTFAPIREQVANCHYFYIRVILESKSRPKFAEAVPDNAHADLTVRNGLPTLGSCCTRFGNIFEALNGLAVFVDDLF